MSTWYRLDANKNPVPIDWPPTDAAFKKNKKGEWRVGWDKIGDVEVSPVFLALDHNFGGGPPILFETMIFGGPLDQEQKRYYTWKEAEAGHARWVERVKRKQEGV